MSEPRRVTDSSIIRVAGNIASGIVRDASYPDDHLRLIARTAVTLARMIANEVEGSDASLLTSKKLEHYLAARGYARKDGAVVREGRTTLLNEGYMFAMAEVFDLLEGRVTS
jgi:hypothetical protein